MFGPKMKDRRKNGPLNFSDEDSIFADPRTAEALQSFGTEFLPSFGRGGGKATPSFRSQQSHAPVVADEESIRRQRRQIKKASEQQPPSRRRSERPGRFGDDDDFRSPSKWGKKSTPSSSSSRKVERSAPSSSSTRRAAKLRLESSDDAAFARRRRSNANSRRRDDEEDLMRGGKRRINKYKVESVVSARQCSSCGGDSGSCGCSSNDPWKFVFVNDGYVCDTHFLYSVMYGWTPTAGVATFVLTAQDWGNVLVTPAVGQTIDTVAAQLGFDEFTSLGDAVGLYGTGTQVFDTMYVVARLPTSTNASYLLQPVNYLESPCLAPIAGDYLQIRHGTSASILEISQINLTDLSWVLVSTSLGTVVNAVVVRIACCD
jgi:hypothetical protein